MPVKNRYTDQEVRAAYDVYVRWWETGRGKHDLESAFKKAKIRMSPQTMYQRAPRLGLSLMTEAGGAAASTLVGVPANLVGILQEWQSMTDRIARLEARLREAGLPTD